MTSETLHLHHIVPRYHCKKLGIDPDFKDNFVMVTRHQHALIHWGYYCRNLNPLLEVCTPKQYVLDMIPQGEGKDGTAAALIALNEVDEIVVPTGKNHPSYKHGFKAGMSEYMKIRKLGRLQDTDCEDVQKAKRIWNEANKKYKRMKNELSDEYSERERKRKRDNHRLWPSYLKKKYGLSKDSENNNTLQQFFV